MRWGGRDSRRGMAEQRDRCIGCFICDSFRSTVLSHHLRDVLEKATAKAALASIVVSSVVILLGLGLMGTTAVEPIMIGLAVSGAIMVSVSLLGSRIKDADINKDDL